jgi:hypothetical protein
MMNWGKILFHPSLDVQHYGQKLTSNKFDILYPVEFMWHM